MVIDYRLSLKLIRFLTLIFLMILLCFQSTAGATLGIAEWESSTPGGNKIGNNDGLPSNVHTAIYKDYSTIYIKNVQEYGFYTGVIIGKAEQGFFLFNETTKEVNYFSNQEQLCSKVKEKNLKLDSIYCFYNLVYYCIRYSLDFLMSFMALFFIHQQTQRKSPLSHQVDTILQSKLFGLQFYATSVGLNLILLLVITLSNPEADFLGLMIFAPFGFILLSFIFLLLWLLAQVALKLVNQADNILQNFSIFNESFTSLLTSLLKWIFFVGIFVAGLSLTFSSWEVPFVSFRYFSCQFS